MAKYMFQASYTLNGVNGLLEVGGSHRAEVVKGLIGSVGGTLEAFYYAFGDDDIYIIAELPDDAAAAALSLKVFAAGSATVKTTVLLDPTVIDEAREREVSYSPPAG